MLATIESGYTKADSFFTSCESVTKPFTCGWLNMSCPKSASLVFSPCGNKGWKQGLQMLDGDTWVKIERPGNGKETFTYVVASYTQTQPSSPLSRMGWKNASTQSSLTHENHSQYHVEEAFQETILTNFSQFISSENPGYHYTGYTNESTKKAFLRWAARIFHYTLQNKSRTY